MSASRRWLILIATSIVSFMATLDASIVNIALPYIARELKVPMSTVELVTSVYMIAICVLLIFWGKLSDSVGRIWLFQLGTILFALGSLFCGLSMTLPWLLTARLIQATGAAMTMATNFGIITAIFPMNQHGRALGVNGALLQLGNIAGPGIGGGVLAVLSWHWIFLINVPVALVAFLIGVLVFPRQRPSLAGAHMDWPGYGSYSVIILGFFITVFWAQTAGLSWVTLLPGMLAFVALVAFVQIERYASDPLIPFAIFKNPGFTIGILTAMIVYMLGYFNSVIMPFYLEETLGLSALTAGFCMMAIPAANVISAPIGGNLGDHFGAERVSFFALFLWCVPMGLFAAATPNWPMGWIVFGLAWSGLANGAFQNNPMMMDNVAPKFQGLAGSMAALGRNLGMTIGVALVTSLLYLNMSTQAGRYIHDYPHGHPQWFIYGMHRSYDFALLLLLLAVLLLGWLNLHRLHERKQPLS